MPSTACRPASCALWLVASYHKTGTSLNNEVMSPSAGSVERRSGCTDAAATSARSLVDAGEAAAISRAVLTASEMLGLSRANASPQSHQQPQLSRGAKRAKRIPCMRWFTFKSRRAPRRAVSIARPLEEMI